jgi:peptidoglycan/xylan/chitin deacetylase (PgdA/CDA1 family)
MSGRAMRAARRLGRPAARAVRALRRRGELREAVDVIKGMRGMRLVLVYHRVVPRDRPRYEPVPTVPLHLFREQLDAFGELGRLEPLHSLLDEGDPDAPLRLALTFDDDYDSHARYALPVLGELSLHATFFLSGRDLHGLGGYWFQRLEALVAERGAAAAAELLGVPPVYDAQLPHHCEGDEGRIALIERHAPAGEAPLGAAGIRALSVAGMTIGFHTLHHPVLPRLTDEQARAALTTGRDRLAELVGSPVDWFAYPHGKADDRIVELTREAGYTAAWTTQPGPLLPGESSYRRGRWEPQPMPTDELLIRFAAFLRRRHEPAQA